MQTPEQRLIALYSRPLETTAWRKAVEEVQLVVRANELIVRPPYVKVGKAERWG